MLGVRMWVFFCMFLPLRMLFSVPAITDSREKLGVSGARIRVSLHSRPLDEISRVCRIRHLPPCVCEIQGKCVLTIRFVCLRT